MSTTPTRELELRSHYSTSSQCSPRRTPLQLSPAHFNCEVQTEYGFSNVIYSFIFILERLDLNGCINISKEAVDAVATSCIMLQRIEVCHCNINADELCNLFMRNVEVVYISEERVCVRVKDYIM